MSEFKTNLPSMSLHRVHAGALGATSPSSSKQGDEPIYDRDFVLWIAKQTSLLRDKKFDKLDLENLVEELESMGKSEHRELRNRLETLIMHLLKCQFQNEKICGSWKSTLLEQRGRIGRLTKDSPSLTPLIAEYANEGYESAVHRAAHETELPQQVFPTQNPYSPAQLLDASFVPGRPEEAGSASRVPSEEPGAKSSL